MRSLDPGVLEIKGEPQQQVQVNAGGSAEVRFNIAARAVGRARVQMSVRLRDESDAFEEVIPVEILSTPETVAAYGEAKPDGREAINVPTGVVPGDRRAAPRTVVDRDGRPRRRRALSRRISVRLRRTARLARARAAARGRSRRGVLAAGHRAEGPEGARADGARRTSEVSVRRRRLRLLAGRVLHAIAVSDCVSAARLPGRAEDAVHDVDKDMRRARVRPISNASWPRRRTSTKAGGPPTPRGRRSR